MSRTFDYMPSQYITFRWQYNYRAANVPYFSGPGGVTPPGGNRLGSGLAQKRKSLQHGDPRKVLATKFVEQLLRAPLFVEFRDGWPDGKAPGEDGYVFVFLRYQVLICSVLGGHAGLIHFFGLRGDIVE